MLREDPGFAGGTNWAVDRDQVFQPSLTIFSPLPDGFHSDVMRAELDTHHDELLACYVSAMHDISPVDVTMRITFHVGTSGHIGHTLAITDDTLGNAALNGCVTHAIESYRFPVPSDPAAANVLEALVFSATPPLPPG
jgi:hypothetical protein